MHIINNFVNEEVTNCGNENFNISLLMKYCEENDLVRGEKVGLSLNSKLNDLYFLMDHLYLFENSNGDKYYVSNTYYSNNEIFEIIVKYNLISFVKILGTGFWHPDSTAVLLDYNKIRSLINGVNNNFNYLKYNTSDVEDLFNIMKTLNIG